MTKLLRVLYRSVVQRSTGFWKVKSSTLFRRSQNQFFRITDRPTPFLYFYIHHHSVPNSVALYKPPRKRFLSNVTKTKEKEKGNTLTLPPSGSKILQYLPLGRSPPWQSLLPQLACWTDGWVGAFFEGVEHGPWPSASDPSPWSPCRWSLEWCAKAGQTK